MQLLPFKRPTALVCQHYQILLVFYWLDLYFIKFFLFHASLSIFCHKWKILGSFGSCLFFIFILLLFGLFQQFFPHRIDFQWMKGMSHLSILQSISPKKEAVAKKLQKLKTPVVWWRKEGFQQTDIASELIFWLEEVCYLSLFFQDVVLFWEMFENMFLGTEVICHAFRVFE